MSEASENSGLTLTKDEVETLRWVLTFAIPHLNWVAVLNQEERQELKRKAGELLIKLRRERKDSAIDNLNTL